MNEGHTCRSSRIFLLLLRRGFVRHQTGPGGAAATAHAHQRGGDELSSRENQNKSGRASQMSQSHSQPLHRCWAEWRVRLPGADTIHYVQQQKPQAELMSVNNKASTHLWSGYCSSHRQQRSADDDPWSLELGFLQLLTHNKEWTLVTVGIAVERVVVIVIRVTGRLRKYLWICDTVSGKRWHHISWPWPPSCVCLFCSVLAGHGVGDNELSTSTM